MEEAAVRATAHLVDDVGLEIDVERAGDVFPGGRLGEESAEAIDAALDGALSDTTVRLQKSAFVRIQRVWMSPETRSR